MNSPRFYLLLTLTISLLISALGSFSQFTDLNQQFMVNFDGSDGMYGNGISLYDFNGDGWDDVTFCTDGSSVRTYLNDGTGFFEIMLFDLIDGDIKQAIWVDYDNDDDPDFFCSIFGGSSKLFRNEGNLLFTDVTENLNQPTLIGESFGACWGDYDDDGFPDVYVGNYDFELPEATTNWLFHNNGDGTFTEMAEVMGVANSWKATFQPVWVDFNHDQLLDLFVINDKNHGNNLYLNNGETFDDVSTQFALNQNMESMSNSWADFDNDLDLDLYISNTTDGNKLMRNDGLFFTDIAETAGVAVYSVCWSALWLDFDHNGWEDLHVATNSTFISSNQNYLFRNVEDESFYSNMIQNDFGSVLASAKGDLNNDGYWDYVEMEELPFAIRMFENDGGTNHWIKTKLNGVVSNHDGIGSIIYYYYDDHQYMRHTFCGEGFLGQDSQYEILSLGNKTFLDSLVVKWPSGWIDHYYNLNADQLHSFTEGETFVVEISNVNGNLLCPEGGEVELMVSPGVNYLWSTVEETQNIVVTNPGLYSAKVYNEFGLQSIAYYEVTSYEASEINQALISPSCNGVADGCISLDIPAGEIISTLWNGNAGGAEMCELPADTYVVLVTDDHGCEQSLSIILEEPESLTVQLIADTACYDLSVQAQVAIEGGAGLYTQNWFQENPDSLHAGDYSMEVTDENNCVAIGELSVVEFSQIIFTYTPDTVCFDGTVSLEFELNGGTPDYTIDWAGENPDALSSGSYDFTIVDQSACSIHALVELNESPEIVLTSAIVNAENGDNGSAFVNVSGGMSPYTYLWDNESSSNPLENVGQGNYVVVVSDATYCTATLEVEIIDTRVNELNHRIAVYPNPFNVAFKVESMVGSYLSVHDAFGRVVFATIVTAQQVIVDATGWSSGVYFISQNEKKSVIVKNE